MPLLRIGGQGEPKVPAPEYPVCSTAPALPPAHLAPSAPPPLALAPPCSTARADRSTSAQSSLTIPDASPANPPAASAPPPRRAPTNHQHTAAPATDHP